MDDEIKNSDVIREALKALFAVAGRRESQLFAVMAMDSIIKMLAEQYGFLKQVTIKVKEGVFIGSEEVIIDVPTGSINTIEQEVVGEFLESLIRIILMDLKAKAGLFFISEFKKKIGPEYVSELYKRGVNLGNMQIEQRYLYARLEKEKPILSAPSTHAERREEMEKKQGDAVSLFGYEMGKVSSWTYNADAMVYTLRDKDGRELDKLDLDTIVNKLTQLIEFDSADFDASSTKDDQHRVRGDLGEIEKPSIPESKMDSGEPLKTADKKIEITKKEYQFLEMLFERDLDIKQVVVLLEVSMNDLQYMVKRLLKFEILKYVSDDEVQLTEFGINYMMSLYGA